MGSLSSHLGPISNRRRSQRVLLKIPVVVIALGPDKQPVSEETYTLVVSAHGGLIHLAMKVTVGQELTIKNPETREEQLCRVVRLNTTQPEITEVGFEFVKPAPQFWRISFPPPDWTLGDPKMPAGTL
jgi:hypothetical protein